MGAIISLPLDLLPTAIPFEKQATNSTGLKLNPTSATVRIFEETGGAGAFDNTEVAGSPFTCTILNAKTGNYGVKIAKALFSAGNFYRALFEWTIDGITTASEDTYFMYNTASYKATVTNLDVAVSSRAPASEYDTEMGRIDAAISTRATPANITTAHTTTDGKVDAVKVDTVAIESKVDDVFDNTNDIEAKVDLVQTDTTAIKADTNEIQGKLPTNEIMGSSVKTDKDDEIDAIKLKTDNLPSDPTSEASATVNKDEIIEDIAQIGEIRRVQEG